jgi:hypothetical protein
MADAGPLMPIYKRLNRVETGVAVIIQARADCSKAEDMARDGLDRRITATEQAREENRENIRTLKIDVRDLKGAVEGLTGEVRDMGPQLTAELVEQTRNILRGIAWKIVVGFLAAIGAIALAAWESAPHWIALWYLLHGKPLPM